MTLRFMALGGVLLPVSWILLTISVHAYASGPDPAKTGGFGEMTCHQSGCHVSFDLNEGRAKGMGDLVISGLPKQYEPGRLYSIKLAVTHTESRGYWGFQLAARVKETGAQAGELKPIDGGTQIVHEKGIQYIEHTLNGIAANTFDFIWVAPGSPAGEVIVHASGNAADGNGTPEGDYIYNTSVSVAGPPR